jgi:signal transduction histidine kinase
LVPSAESESLRARLVAVRRQVLGRMYETTLRWRLAWFVPFNIVVFAVIWWQPDHALPAFAQATTLVVAVGFALARLRESAWAFFFHAVHYFVGASLTGALISPLIPLGFPIVASAAVLLETRRSKWLLATTFVVGTITLVLLSKYCAWTVPPAPFERDAWIIRTCTLVFAAVGLLRVGLDATDAYTELALELAARREEVFAESAAHARSLEGVAARLAHEVKNPLAAIKGLSTHMARGAGDEKTKERLDIVAQEADRLQAIVDGFLGFTRGLDDLRIARVLPYDVARELVVLLETRAEEAGVAIEVIGDERADVRGDARKIRQALLNVVLNALEASPRGSSVTIAVARGAPDTVRVRVTDRGAGMSAAVLERLRKPHFTTKPRGSGLGVAIARAFVEQHGGTMTIESAEGAGTTVVIELPAAGPSKAARPLPGVSDVSSAP